MPEPKRYVKLPVVIEAMRFDGSLEGSNALTTWLIANGVTSSHSWDEKEHPDHPGVYVDDIKFFIPTLEGVMEASMGDYIIRGVQGEFYPCKPDIFAATYREMTDD